MKNQKGVTLVALVVTIIVLIILAGISIKLLLGDNGIITIAKKAKENTELAKIEEETELNELYTQLENNGGTSGGNIYDSIAKLTEFKTAIANAIDEAGGIKPEVSSETAIFADNIKGILKEVTKDATATAEDIVEGKTAWVNGEMITGNSTGNSSNGIYYVASSVGFNNGYQWVQKFDCTSIDGWQSLVSEDFVLKNLRVCFNTDSTVINMNHTITYNNTDGTVSVVTSTAGVGIPSYYIEYDLYVVKELSNIVKT